MSSRIFLCERVLCAVVAIACCAGLRAQDCEPQWTEGLFEFPGPGVDGIVHAFGVFDDGTGAGLYVGGLFGYVGGLPIEGLTRWDGHAWSAVGGGIKGPVYALGTFDDGTGPALYVGGRLTLAGSVPVNGIARWNGAVWSPLGDGIDGNVRALAVYDDGSGPALYAGGYFSSAGGTPIENLAKWDGSAWSDVGGGVNGEVSALAVLDDGTGPVLCVAGNFSMAGDVLAENVACWNGTEWAPFGDGLQRWVSALAVYDDGAGPALYAASSFATEPGVWRWDGATWIPVGDPPARACEALAVIDLGAGPQLAAGGRFADIRGEYVGGVAVLGGETWSLLGNGPDFGVLALTAFDDSNRPALFAGGSFRRAGEAVVNGVARWSGDDWESFGGTTDGKGLNTNASALATFDDGTGHALYAAGGFDTAGTTLATGIARWDGGCWSALGSGVDDGYVRALAVFQDGAGEALYAGGSLQRVGGVACRNVARWDGNLWTSVGAGVPDEVFAMTVFDDGSGPALYATGRSSYPFIEVNVYKWDGTAWSAMPEPITGDIPFIWALAGFDDGSGPALYAGGLFSWNEPASYEHIAKWDGTGWVSVGGGVAKADGLPYIQSLCIFDDGSGPALYAGGDFDAAGGVPANRVARWDGTRWSALGEGVTGGTSPGVSTLTEFDDGSGPALYVGGQFEYAGGIEARNIARWDGTQWSPLSDGVAGGSAYVRGMRGFDDGVAPALYVAGQFTLAGGFPSSNIARWGCPMIVDGDVDGDGDVDLSDLALLLAAYGACDGDPNYNAAADFDGDGCINLTDLARLLSNYGYGA
jgi:hypothetical protein